MIPTDPTLLGSVRDVKGGTVSISLDKDTISGLTFLDGRGYRIGQIGSFVRIPLGYTDLFGVVSQVGAGAVPEKLVEAEPHGDRWMTIQLVGEGQRRARFERGISQYPTIGDRVYLVTEQDLYRIYGHPNSPKHVAVGHLASAESIPALVDIDKLVTRHSAVVGTTGAGKSTTVASLLRSLSDPATYPSARILVFDIHGEYANAFKDQAAVFRVNSNAVRGESPLFIPYWAMTFDEFLSITFGSLDDTARGAVLEKITALKASALDQEERKGVNKETLTVDTPVPFSVHTLWLDLHCLVNATHTVPGSAQTESTVAFLLGDDNKPVQPGDAMRVIPPRYRPQNQAAGNDKIYLSNSPLNVRRHLEGLASRLRDPRFDFLFRPGPWCPDANGVTKADLDSLLGQWIGGPQPITIFDLSGIPPSIMVDLVGVLLRITYDALFWARYLCEGGRERPLLVVLEEAHVYLNQADSAAAAAVRRIVKEGRKYGIGAMIISQRPSEIDPTILSQCGTMFAMRLSNPADRAHVTGAVTDNLEGLLSMLPVLRTGEALIVGEAVNLPVRTLIARPAHDRQPDSSDPLVFDELGPGGWNRQREKNDYGQLVTVWRKQDPRSPQTSRQIDKDGE